MKDREYGRAPAKMFDFLAGGQASVVRRGSLLPLAASVAAHAAGVTLVLALTFSGRIVERPPPRREVILLAPPPRLDAAHPASVAARHTTQRRDPTPAHLFHAPVGLSLAEPLRAPPPLPALLIPLPEVARPTMPATEVARLPVAPPPPLRTDNLAALGTSAPIRAPSAIAISRPAGFSDVTSAINRMPLVLRSSGFNQIVVDASAHSRAPPLSNGQFEDATMVPAGLSHRAGTAPVLPVMRSVEILSKPRPAYTDEARVQRIDGEVLLEILFAASGQVRVLGTVRGLGHGLDESAIAAAESIRFRPAERAGIAVDSTAIVHIVFQLAY